MNDNTQKDAYISIDNTRKIPKIIIDHLFANSTDLWKLLKYSEVDALDKPNLTNSEKKAMISTSSLDTDKHILFQKFNSDVNTKGKVQLRLEVASVRPYKTRSNGLATILFQIIVPNKAQIISSDISPYDRRDLAISSILLDTFNGKDINDLGTMFWNPQIDSTASLTSGNFNTEYSGFQLTMNIIVNA